MTVTVTLQDGATDNICGSVTRTPRTATDATLDGVRGAKRAHSSAAGPWTDVKGDETVTEDAPFLGSARTGSHEVLAAVTHLSGGRSREAEMLAAEVKSARPRGTRRRPRDYSRT